MKQTTPCEHCGATRRHRLGCPRSTAPASRSELAARELSERGGTVAAVATAHGVTQQSVCQTWIKLFPGVPLPLARARSARDDKIAELAVGGASRAEIANAVPASPFVVARVLHARGLTARDDVADVFAAAVAAVITGEHPVDAAADAGVSYAGLRNRLAALGIEAAQDRQAAPQRRTGRIARAVELAQQGTPVPEACAAERCAPSSVYAALRKAAQMPT